METINSIIVVLEIFAGVLVGIAFTAISLDRRYSLNLKGELKKILTSWFAK